ncbi:hypothetical protein JW930_00955 [Candidatus Woesearchaeota archaeon]|nr:hypothetical protein [Candidatus Woesearchaeota archaeon]
MSNKKAYVFILDAIMALIILTIGFLVISSTYSNKPALVTTRNMAEDLLNVMAAVKVSEICPDCGNCAAELNSICGDIKNRDNTVLELIGEQYSLGTDTGQLINEIIMENKLLPGDSYEFSLYIHDGNGEHKLYPGANQDEDKARILISSKKLVMGYYVDKDNDYKTEYWGPYLIEIRTWQK